MRWAVVALVLVGCAHRVRQDAHTGPDGGIAGATALRLDDRVTARGIVTYPGGDRVDWYVVRLARPGEVRVDLRWRSPRPGLQLGFDVFDAYNDRLGVGRRRGPTHRSSEHTASDLVYVRVYARGRGDAGKYRLTLTRQDVRVIVDDWGGLQIPDPPMLAEVPPNPFVCDDEHFDPKRPECRNVCPMHGAPRCWPACLDACRDLPPPPPPPPPPPAPVVGRVIAVDVDGDGLLVRVGVGSDNGVTTAWRATIARDAQGVPLSGGSATIVHVEKHVTTLKVKLTSDQVHAAPYAKLQPPVAP